MKNASPIELAYKTLFAHPQGMTSKQLARAAFRLRGKAPAELAASLLRQSLAGDERFAECGDGRWRLTPFRDPIFLDDTVFTIVDVETTGGLASHNRIIEIAAFRLYRGKISENYMSLIHPQRKIPLGISYLTGIYDEHVADAPVFSEIAEPLAAFIGDTVFVAQSAQFDFRFVNMEFMRAGIPAMQNPVLCTVKLSRRFFPQIQRYNLDALCAHFAIDLTDERHRAHGDAWATAIVLRHCLNAAQDWNIETLQDLFQFQATPPARLKKEHFLKDTST
jgi:DNA polymerase III epsilon subunit family exonuclease